MTVVRQPQQLAESGDDDNTGPQPRSSGHRQKGWQMLLAAAAGSFFGRFAGDAATDARREWLPKILSWFE